MIQDILPHHFDNVYHPRQPRGEDLVLLYRQGSILIRRADMPYLRVRELCDEDRAALQYLFAVDDTACYTLLGEMKRCPNGMEYVSTRWLRTLRPHVLAMIGISGHQLWSWYRSRTFCGGCGRLMHHDAHERMMRCAHCGRQEYPKICPAVIVAVVDRARDAIVLTRYAGRQYQKYALIAGFCEIGETLEETVRREVMEETGLKVKHLRYYKSQPWSFTDTLLCGFFGELEGSPLITRDERELAEARWVKREDVPMDEEGISLTGEMMRVFREGSAFEEQGEGRGSE